MTILIGVHMKINQALDAIQFGGAIPVFEFRGFLYHIDIKGRRLGSLHYTKFSLDGTTAIHSVNMPFATNLTLGETIQRGEGLREKMPPTITELPPETNSILTAIDQVQPPIITFFNPDC